MRDSTDTPPEAARFSLRLLGWLLAFCALDWIWRAAAAWARAPGRVAVAGHVALRMAGAACVLAVVLREKRRAA